MKLSTSLFAFFLVFLAFSGISETSAQTSKSKKLYTAVKQKVSTPSKRDIAMAVQSLKDFGFYGVKDYVDCYSFCDEVCDLLPGGVCYCDRQSYSCPGDPTSYPFSN